MTGPRHEGKTFRMTETERRIVALLGAGLSPLTVVEKLGISTSAVDMHMRNAREKLGLATNQALREYAIAEAKKGSLAPQTAGG